MSTKVFEFPAFHSYPPYYTLQPVDITREKQCSSWGSLILTYCKHHKIFKLQLDDTDESELFCNKSIRRKLSAETKKVFFEWLVKRGYGIWRENDEKQLLILWKTIAQWADTIMEWVYTFSLEESVLTVDEISHGEETSGTELEGLDREIVIRAVGVLETKSQAKLFRGTSDDDVGIKFFKRPE